jgi:transposase-like protein
MAEKALTAVIQEASIQDISTRSVDDLIKAMSMTGISKRQACPERSRRVSRPCEEIDQQVRQFSLMKPREAYPVAACS